MKNKTATSFVCQSCTYQVPKWVGKCPECNEWNTFQEEVYVNLKTKAGKKVQSVLNVEEIPRLVRDVSLKEQDRIKTTINEFDRVLGGGLVPGSLILIGGEPGIGKSTKQSGKKLENNLSN